jgi:hypothetical protein
VKTVSHINIRLFFPTSSRQEVAADADDEIIKSTIIKRFILLPVLLRPAFLRFLGLANHFHKVRPIPNGFPPQSGMPT